jgi:protein-tyrosine-phosphatase
MRVLFVCRGNICRSRVAEQIFQVLTWSVGDRGDHEARSAGVDPDPGGRLITKRDVKWADVICVMESEHEAYIREHWSSEASKVRVLGIPDVYEPDDPELRDRLTKAIRGLLGGGGPGHASAGGRRFS